MSYSFLFLGFIHVPIHQIVLSRAVFEILYFLKHHHYLSLFVIFRELGNLRAARGKFNRSLEINSNHSLTLQLRANMYYYSGDPMKALQDDQVRHK